MKKILIKNGMLISPTGMKDADILINKEVIEKIGQGIETDDVEIIDASDQYIFPGFIDAHTHMGIPIKDTQSADDFDSGTLAALHGGVTTVMGFTVQETGEGLLSSLERRKKLAQKKANTDYSFHCNVTELNDSVLKEIPDIVKQGIISFKAFTAYKDTGMQLNDRQILDLLWAVKIAGGTVMFHAENGDLIDFLSEKFIKYNKTTPLYHGLSRPAESEIEAVWRITTLNQFILCPIYFVHLTTAEAVQLAGAAKERKQSVYIETCPQYLIFDKSIYNKESGHRFIASPPFRNKRDIDYLWQAVQQGTIDTVGTDHCPFTIEQKDMGSGLFHQTPNGLAGVETMFPLLYTEGVKKDRLSLHRLISLISEEPARLFGLYPQKGALLEGSDADIVIFNPEGQSKISAENLHSNTVWSPYENFDVSGEITNVFLRGKRLIKNGRTLKKNLKKGKFVKALI